MATRQGDRVNELRKEIEDAASTVDSPEDVQAVLSTLWELRRQGLTRAHYNLASPYGEGLHHYHQDQDHG
jgi:hypothetical protein